MNLIYFFPWNERDMDSLNVPPKYREMEVILDILFRSSKELLEASLLLSCLKNSKPSYWFSAHSHCKFTALVEHEEGGEVTKFLAGPCEVQYDEEWLAIAGKFSFL
ncbi:hypothetical protein V6Z12_A08G000100 [Gossypium hirsutum]